MIESVEHEQIDAVLRNCGATWNASQAHGLLCGRIAVRGTDARTGWLEQLVEGAERKDLTGGQSVALLDALFSATWLQLAARQSQFMPLLPAEMKPAGERAEALAHWSEGFLHGLVSGQHPESLRTRLAAEPISDIIKDMLEITRAAADDDADEEGREEAYVELVEYIRVAAQLVFEELAEFRAGPAAKSHGSTLH